MFGGHLEVPFCKESVKSCVRLSAGLSVCPPRYVEMLCVLWIQTFCWVYARQIPPPFRGCLFPLWLVSAGERMSSTPMPFQFSWSVLSYPMSLTAPGPRGYFPLRVVFQRCPSGLGVEWRRLV